MTVDDAEITVRRIIARRFAVDERVLSGEAVLKDDLGASSLTLVELLVELEKSLNTTVDCDLEWDGLRVDDVVSLAKRSVQGLGNESQVHSGHP
jgi:acyl carrier protein